MFYIVFYGYGDNCALLLSQSRKVFTIGKSSCGCLGLGELTETAEPVELKELSGVAGVCVCGTWAGDALAYTSEGKVYVWGNNVSWNRPQLVPELTDVVDARCRGGHYLALTKSGKLYEWRGVKTSIDALSATPKVVTLIEVITSIACGLNHSLALTKDGQVYSWGMKWNDGFINQQMTQITLPGETVAKIACGLWHSLVLTNTGKLYTWGRNVCGLGDPSGSTKSETPVQVGQNIGRFVDIAVNGYWTNAAVSNTGAVYMWGEEEKGSEVKEPTITEHLEIHQVFANIHGSNYSWTLKTPSSNTEIVEDSSSVAGNLEASRNDEQDCNEAAIIQPEGHLEQSQNNADCAIIQPEGHLEQSQTNADCAIIQPEGHLEQSQTNADCAIIQPEGHLQQSQTKADCAIIQPEGHLEQSQTNADCAIIQPEGHLEQSQTNADCGDHAESKIYHFEEYVENLKKELAELKENNTKLKDELKEENTKLKEENDKLKDEIYKLKNELKDDNAKLKD